MVFSCRLCSSKRGYGETGVRVAGCGNFMWFEESTYVKNRVYMYYSDDSPEQIQHAFQPRFEEISGAVPVNTLLGGKIKTGLSIKNNEGPIVPTSGYVTLGEYSGALQVQTASGYVRIGPQSTSYSHIITDRAKFYINKPMIIDGGNTSGNAYNISSYSSEDLVFATQEGAENRMTIKSDTGNVGIGTTTPASKLHVIGGANDEVVALFTTAGGTSGSVEGKAHIGLSHFSSDTVPSVSISAEEVDASDHRADFRINTRVNNSANAVPTEKMRVTYDGKVGIGTNSPDAKLDVDEVADGIGLRVRRNDSSTSVPLVKFIDDSTGNDGPSVLEIQNDVTNGLQPSLMITGGSISIKEQTNAPADTAAYGQIWVKTATPNELYFTTDAGNDIQLSSSAFNRYAQFFYQGDNVSNTANYDFKVLGANASSSNINSYGMPVAGVVKAMTIRNAGGGTITSTTNGATFAVRVNGAQSGTTDYETVVLDGDNMARAFGSGSGFAVATLDFNQAFAAGDALQVRRVSGDITFEEVLITLWIDFT